MLCWLGLYALYCFTLLCFSIYSITVCILTNSMIKNTHAVGYMTSQLIWEAQCYSTYRLLLKKSRFICTYLHFCFISALVVIMTYDVKRQVKECDTVVNKRTDRSARPSKYFSSFDNASVSILQTGMLDPLITAFHKSVSTQNCYRTAVTYYSHFSLFFSASTRNILNSENRIFMFYCAKR